MESAVGTLASRGPYSHPLDLTSLSLQRSSSHGRLQDEEDRDGANSKYSPQSSYTDFYSSEGSMLAYASTPSLNDFPVPPATPTPGSILPHPHAPAAPSSGSLPPAIHRLSESTYYSVSHPSTKTLSNTLAQAAVVGRHQGRSGSTIHGRTSFDLLSAKGPVPIHFALGQHQPVTTNPTPSIPPANHDSVDDHTTVPEVDIMENQSEVVITSTKSSPPLQSPSNMEATGFGLAPPVPRDRRSFTDIINAIETPR